jgi:glycosyltransferase involved in cell wall biosynthesis
MRIASADVYYQNCAEYVTGQIALWCQLHRKRFVYSVASDPDCDKLLPKMRTTREKILYRYGIRHADHIIVQTNRQQEMLRSNFGRKAEVIAMACPGPGPSWTPPTIDERQPKRVLWVGRVAPVKQLEWLLDIAELAPDLVFEVAGPLDKSDYVQKLQKRAEQLSNVILRGAVQRSDMPLCYTSAAVMCCTSSYEGFPNTFLEAWSHGTPVISTVDPDNVISKLQLGEIGHTPNELLASIRLLLEAPKRWKIISKNARCYYLQNHTEEKVLPQFEQAFFSNLSKNN